jgi:flavin-dependent dehydrogenase
MYDAIVVGARAAGATTAMLLARKGHNVLLVDRDSFPSDTISTHVIAPPGVAALKRWGLYRRVRETGAPELTEVRLDFGAFRLAGRPTHIQGTDTFIAPRRTALDAVLIQAAIEAGAEFRPHFGVHKLIRGEDRVIGISGDGEIGPAADLGRVVIGADGRNSAVARMLGLEKYDVVPALTCLYYSYWKGAVREPVAATYVRPGFVVTEAPTNSGELMVAVQWPIERFAEIRDDPDRHLVEATRSIAGLKDRIQGAPRERIWGTADLENFFRPAAGPGWALVGDAGYHRDPALGQGISNAFDHAEMLAGAVDAGLRGEVSLDGALAGYRRERDESVRDMYGLVTELASMQPVPKLIADALAALEGNERDTRRALGAHFGTYPIPEFFAPANLRRIIAGAPRPAQEAA